MSTPANETMPAPVMPPPTAASDLPAPPPSPIPLADGPRLAASPPPPPMTAEPPVTLLLPGSEAELPRLGEPGTVTAQPVVSAPTEPTFDMSALQGADAPVLPSLPTTPPQVTPAQVTTPAAPTEPASADSTDTTDDDEAAPVAQPDHPMAHLMSASAPVTEASKRAAEARAEMKKRSKRIKFALIAGFVAVTAAAVVFVGPWLVDAINEAGDTSEDPAVETVDEP